MSSIIAGGNANPSLISNRRTFVGIETQAVFKRKYIEKENEWEKKNLEGNKRTSLLYFIVQLFHNIILYWVLSVDPPIHVRSRLYHFTKTIQWKRWTDFWYKRSGYWLLIQ